LRWGVPPVAAYGVVAAFSRLGDSSVASLTQNDVETWACPYRLAAERQATSPTPPYGSLGEARIRWGWGGEVKGGSPSGLPLPSCRGAAIHLPHSSLRELRGGKDMEWIGRELRGSKNME
jgi:hypothetical protein